MYSPIVSIIIATFNSEKVLAKVLESIRKQSYNQNNIEVILVDGGSTDKTLRIAKQFRCRILGNPRTEPVWGKFLGFISAKGRYLMYLDHDEVLENINSIELKLKVFRKNNNVKAVVSSGYKSPEGYPFINYYINEFGDPFSFFIYKLSKDAKFFSATMNQKYPMLDDNDFFTIFDLSRTKILPLIELVAGGSMFDAYTLKREFPETKERYELLPHYFYLLHYKYPYLAIAKNDTLIHYSADTLKRYFKKIKWRVKNNIYHASDMGESGFLGRDKFQPLFFRLKKYLFLPYAYSLIFPLFDSIRLIVTRRNIIYFFHLILTVYTANLIVYHFILKLIGGKSQLRSYDESKIIKIE